MDRLSRADSRKFVSYLRTAMKDRGLSVYGLYLLTDLSKASVYRWFRGACGIGVDGAGQLLHALARDGRSPSLDKAAELLARERASDSIEKRLLVELKARKLPRRRTLDALRAAGIPGFD